MKKFKLLSCFLSLCLLLQCLVIPAASAEADESTEPNQSVEQTEPGYVDIPEVEFGSASLTNGCRTINGMMPLSGMDKILKTAQAAFVYERSTKTIIYAYNPDVRLYPGSLSKMVTALLAIEHGKLDDVVTLSTKWNNTLPLRAQVAKLKEGEQVTLEALLHWLMLESANDAALNIADYVSGSLEAFVELMNERVKAMGCTDTHFTNVHGLDDPEQYTTARDMAKIVLAATENEIFREIFSTELYDVEPTNRTDKERRILSDNYMIHERILNKFYDNRVTGGKTSSTGGSGSSLVCTAEDDGMDLIFVIMGASRTYNTNGLVDYYGNFDEMTELLLYTVNGFRIARVLYPDMTLNQFPVANGECEVVGQPDISVNSVLPADCHMKNLIFRYTVEGGGLYAPISKGQKIATVSIWYKTSCITEAELFALNSVRSQVNSGLTIHGVASRDDSGLTGILKFIGIAFLVVVLPVGGYLGINAYRRAAARKRRLRRRARNRRSR